MEAGAPRTVDVWVRVSETRAAPGDRITVTLGWRFDGGSVTPTARLWCRLPTGLRLLTAEGGRWDAAEASVAWELGSLDADGAGQTELVAEVVGGAGLPLQVLAGLGAPGEAALAEAQGPEILVALARASVVLTASAADAGPGDVLLYTVTYGCTSAATAGAGHLDLKLPPHCQLVSTTGGGALGELERRVQWQIPALSPGDGDTVMATVRIDPVLPGGVTPLRAEAALDSPGLARAARAPAVTTLVAGAPRLVASLRAGQTRASAGDRVGVTLAVTNTGTSAAEAVVARLPTLERALIVPDGADEPVQEIELGTVAVGETRALRWDIVLDASFPAGETTLRPTAQLIGAGLDHPMPLETAALIVSAEPRLRIELEVDRDEAQPGDTILYIARYTSCGTAPATNVHVALPIPERTVPIAELTTGRPDTMRRQLQVRLGDLPVGASGEARLAVRLAEVFPAGTTRLIVEAAAKGAAAPLVRSAAAITRVVARAALELNVTTAAHTASPGDRIQFTLRCRNTGTASAADVWASATLPPRAGVAAAPGASAVDSDDSELVWSMRDLAPGEERTASCTLLLASVFPDGETPLAMACRARWGDGAVEADSPEVRVSAAPALRLSLECARSAAAPGEIVRYALAWENSGDAVAHGVQAVLALDDRLTPLSQLGTLLLLGDIAPGETGRAELNARLASVFPAGETLVHAAARLEGVPAEHAAAVVRVRAAPALELTATVDRPSAEPGGSLAYKVEYRNTGNAPTEVFELMAELPEELTVLSAGAGGSASDERAVRWSVGPLEPGVAGSCGLVLRLADCFVAGTSTVRVAFRCEAAGTRASAESLARSR